MERAVHYQLISTATAIFKLSRDLHSAYDLGDSTSCIFVDCKKAFGTLSHKILIEKMHAYMDLARKVLDD